MGDITYTCLNGLAAMAGVVIRGWATYFAPEGLKLSLCLFDLLQKLVTAQSLMIRPINKKRTCGGCEGAGLCQERWV